MNLVKRKCCRCGVEKPLDDFWSDKNKPLGKQYSCISCAKIYQSTKQKEYYKKNKHIKAAQHKRYYKKNREKILSKQRKAYYVNPTQRWKNLSNDTDLSIEEIEFWFKKQWMKQQAQCKICGKVFSDDDCIDHNHKTLKLRALLCNRCNNMIGFSGDSADICYKAADYLEEYSL